MTNDRWRMTKEIRNPNDEGWPDGRHWNLVLGISLELGVWDLGFAIS
jgi:hypothetical protein